jgi:hypothetical protein
MSLPLHRRTALLGLTAARVAACGGAQGDSTGAWVLTQRLLPVA